MFKITGETPKFERVITGLTTFDWALGDQDTVGLPLGQLIEIYGSNGIGKSTFVQSLSFMLAKETKGNIALADYEGVNVKVLLANAEMQGYDGDLHRIQDIKDERILQDLDAKLSSKTENYTVGIVDAVGSISPYAETSGDLGDANMGTRAKLLAQFSRRSLGILIRNPNKTVILINHQHPTIGGFSKGTITPGGETKKYIASIRIQLNRMYRKNREDVFKDGSYAISGKVVKNRWGLEDRQFFAFVLGGYGVHKGLTAMYETVVLGIATAERNVVKIDKEIYGNLYELINHAKQGNNDMFIPFFDALKNVNLDIRSKKKSKDDDDEEEE
jgi:RecA/RadA recombinase